MTLYNFFTEVVEDGFKINALKECFNQLKEICVAIQLVEFNTGFSNQTKYSIIGQIYGDDTNMGDLDLLSIFGNEIEYTFFDAYCNKINNIKSQTKWKH